MITVLVTKDHSYTFERLQKTQRGRFDVQVLRYESLKLAHEFQPGLIIFADLERLMPVELWMMSKLARRLQQFPKLYTVCNPPQDYVGRFDLCQKLFDEGVNSYRAHRIYSLPDTIRYPVFLRHDGDHCGAKSELIYDRESLDVAIAPLLDDLVHRWKYMVIELVDMRDEQGLSTKYSAFMIAGELIPFHTLVSHKWEVKDTDVLNEQTVAEELAYIGSKCHADIRKAFEIAGLTFGRVDYGEKDGRVDVWEINTNPMLLRNPEYVDPLQEKNVEVAHKLLLDLFEQKQQTNELKGKSVFEPGFWSSLWYGIQRGVRLYLKWQPR